MSHYANRFAVLVDACCLAGGMHRNIILSLAAAGYFRVNWSERILEETGRAISRITDNHANVEKQLNNIRNAFPEASIEGYEALEQTIAEGMKDKDDAHVIAAAVHCDASVIVTDNLKDFPPTLLKQYNIETKSSDDFIADCIDLDKVGAMKVLNTMRQRCKKPALTWEELCLLVEKRGLTQTSVMMQEFIGLF